VTFGILVIHVEPRTIPAAPFSPLVWMMGWIERFRGRRGRFATKKAADR